MKPAKQTIRLLFLLLLGVFSCTSITQEDRVTVIFEEEIPHLLVMHPTVQNLKRMLFLTGEGIFPLDEEYRIIGVYHDNASYNYSLSTRFILEEGLDHIALYGIEELVQEGDLFEVNDWTPHFKELFHQSEGVFFLGGPDIPPSTYGEAFNLLTVVTDPWRHYLELSFLFHLLGGYQASSAFTPLLETHPEYAILGICLGMQTMNVASGGTMYQDIPTEIYDVHTVEEVIALDPDAQHRNYYSYYRLDPDVSVPTFHRIRIDPFSHMGVILGEQEKLPYVLSSHHQALKELGAGFRATAWSVDKKVVEAIEHETYPHVVGIQFHPEVPYLYNPEHTIIFQPGAENGRSFPEMYPGVAGKDFHRSFWMHIAGMLPQ